MSVHSILVATDLSSQCDRPLDRALALAQQWNAKLTVLHVLRPARKENQRAEEALAYDRVLADLPQNQAEVEILIRTGPASETIVRIAEESGAGLIVTGVAHIDSVHDFFFGTAVEHIVRHADLPTLVVKQRPRQPYDKLLISTDLSECSRAALLVAAEMFPNATLHLVHPYHVPYEGWFKSDTVRLEVRESAQGELENFLDDPKLSDALRQRIRPFLDYGETGEVIGRALHDTGANLLVVGTHRRNIANRLINRTVEALLGSTPSDTLMIRMR